MWRLYEEARRLAYSDSTSQHSLDDACERFILEHLPILKPEGAARYRSSLKALLRHLDPAAALSDMGQEMFTDYITKRRGDEVTDTAIRRDLACLSSVLTSAVEWGWLRANPLRQFKRRALRKDVERIRYLERPELDRLASHAGADRPLILFAVETGMRLSEILGLRWRDVDEETSVARLTETKTDTPRVVPLSAIAKAQIRAQTKGVAAERVFRQANGEPHARQDVSRRFRVIAKAAGVEDFRFHDLRHTFASWKIWEGWDLYRVGKMLGHKGPQMTMRYAHLRTDDIAPLVKGRAQKRPQPHGTKGRKK